MQGVCVRTETAHRNRTLLRKLLLTCRPRISVPMLRAKLVTLAEGFWRIDFLAGSARLPASGRSLTAGAEREGRVSVTVAVAMAVFWIGAQELYLVVQAGQSARKLCWAKVRLLYCRG